MRLAGDPNSSVPEAPRSLAPHLAEVVVFTNGQEKLARVLEVDETLVVREAYDPADIDLSPLDPER
jgi:hypothetical protein